jgi:hypothetical protein
MIQIISNEKVLAYIFDVQPNEDDFWSRSQAIQEGSAFQPRGFVFQNGLLDGIFKLVQNHQNICFNEQNLKNLLILMKKLEPLNIYADELLQMYLSIAINHDVFFKTEPCEDSVLQS